MSKYSKQFWLLLVISMVSPWSRSQGTAFSYQGQLTDGQNPANGAYDMQFGVYDGATGGNLVGSLVTNTAVLVSNGLFTTTIDFGSGVFAGQALWLDIAVSTNGAGTFSALTPRQPLTPTPYAIFSATAQTAASADSVNSGAISATQLNTIGAPAPGQVLAYNGSQLTWQDPVVGGNSGGWSLVGNLGTTPGANFLGTLDAQPLELKVAGMRALRLEPDSTANGAPNVIGGSPANYISSGLVGSTIAGGGGLNLSNQVTASFAAVGGGVKNVAGGTQSVVAGGYQNLAAGYISAVSGGAYNTAAGSEAFVGGGAYDTANADFATVGGGYGNTASGLGPVTSFIVGGPAVFGLLGTATVGGGYLNQATGTAATVPGGLFNVASGDLSFAAGVGAQALHAGSFVWADYSPFDYFFSSTTSNQFLIRATGGVGIGTAQTPPGGLRVDSGGFAVTGASSPNYAGAAGVFVEKLASAGAIYSYDYTAGGPRSLALNSPGGNVGIGILAPQAKLHLYDPASISHRIETGGGVNAWARIEFANGDGQWNVGTSRGYNGDQLYFNRQGVSASALALQPNGDATFGGNVSVCTLTIRGGCDLAEPFATTEPQIERGAVLVIDPAHPGQLRQSDTAYDTRVAGVVSGANGVNPGIAMHQEGALEGGQNVALSGRVYVLVDAGSASIEPGDLLTTSSTPGHAMKATDHSRAQGAILGKAMTGLAAGKGMVLTLVTLQ